MITNPTPGWDRDDRNGSILRIDVQFPTRQLDRWPSDADKDESPLCIFLKAICPRNEKGREYSGKGNLYIMKPKTGDCYDEYSADVDRS